MLVENFPAPQSMHALFPPSFWYLPLKQFEHPAAPPPETVPAPQLPHVSDDADPTVVEDLPAAQSVQSSAPVTVLYLPATQNVHVPPDGPDVPTLQ